MPYSRFYPAGWRNKPDLSTAITKDALDHMEDGIAAGGVELVDNHDGTRGITTGAGEIATVVGSDKVLALGHGEVSIADPRFGTWPPTGGIISDKLDAAIAYAQGLSRTAGVVVPAGSWTITRTPNWGTTTSPSIYLRGGRRGPTLITSTDPTAILVNVVQRVTRLEVTDLTFVGGWGLVRLADTSAASISDASRVIDRVTGYNITGTWISSANSDQANWYIRCRAVAVEATSDPTATGGTIGVAINGLMDGADIVASFSKFRIGGKFGHSGQNSRITIYHVYDQDSTRTWWGTYVWLVPEQNGPGNTDGRGPGHPGGSFKSCKLGNENFLSAYDYRFLSADPMGTVPVPGSLSPLLVGVKPSVTAPTGWTVDVEVVGSTFRLVAKKAGVGTMETSPYFGSMADAQTWSTAVAPDPHATYIDIADQAKGTSATGVIPVAATNIPIGDWSTTLPVFTASQGWAIGIEIDDAKVTGIGAGVNPPLWTLTVPPGQVIGCSIRAVKLLDTAGSAQDPNWPSHMAKFIGDTTAVTAGFPLNRIESTVPTTRRKITGTTVMIPPSNVAGVFALPGDQPCHFGTPTGAANGSTHWGTGGSFTSITGNDRRHVVKWSTGTGTTAGAHVDITFAVAHARAPQVQIAMGSNNAAVYVTSITTTGYTLGIIGTADSKNVVVNVLVEQSP